MRCPRSASIFRTSSAKLATHSSRLPWIVSSLRAARMLPLTCPSACARAAPDRAAARWDATRTSRRRRAVRDSLRAKRAVLSRGPRAASCECLAYAVRSRPVAAADARWAAARVVDAAATVAAARAMSAAAHRRRSSTIDVAVARAVVVLFQQAAATLSSAAARDQRPASRQPETVSRMTAWAAAGAAHCDPAGP